MHGLQVVEMPVNPYVPNPIHPPREFALKSTDPYINRIYTYNQSCPI